MYLHAFCYTCPDTFKAVLNSSESGQLPFFSLLLPIIDIIPCKTLDVALGDTCCDCSCEATTINSPYSDIVFELATGIYHLTDCVRVHNANNIIFRRALDSSEVTIECVSYPNNIPGNYDNVVVCNSNNVRFEGIKFTKCGPQSPNVFVNSSSGVVFEDCIFM